MGRDNQNDCDFDGVDILQWRREDLVLWKAQRGTTTRVGGVVK
jgi:hypothetical protein